MLQNDKKAIQQFERELLLSESRRVKILGIAAVTICTLFLASSLFPSLGYVPDSEKLRWTILGALLIAVVYTLVVIFFLNKWLKSGKSYPLWAKYSGATFEATFPTILILMGSYIIDILPVAMTSPAFAVYFLTITLSILRLDGRICFFIGNTIVST